MRRHYLPPPLCQCLGPTPIRPLFDPYLFRTDPYSTLFDSYSELSRQPTRLSLRQRRMNQCPLSVPGSPATFSFCLGLFSFWLAGMSPLRILFFGTAELACPSLSALTGSPAFEVAAVVTG